MIGRNLSSHCVQKMVRNRGRNHLHERTTRPESYVVETNMLSKEQNCSVQKFSAFVGESGTKQTGGPPPAKDSLVLADVFYGGNGIQL